MSRNRASAKAAGASFEKLIADYLETRLGTGIERRVTNGALDRGDITNVRTADGQRVAIECKDVRATSIGAWISEAHREAINDGALVGVVVAKRRGSLDPAQQFVHMTVSDLVALLTGQRTPSDSDCCPLSRPQSDLGAKINPLVQTVTKVTK